MRENLFHNPQAKAKLTKQWDEIHYVIQINYCHQQYPHWELVKLVWRISIWVSFRIKSGFYRCGISWLKSNLVSNPLKPIGHRLKCHSCRLGWANWPYKTGFNTFRFFWKLLHFPISQPVQMLLIFASNSELSDIAWNKGATWQSL